ncbi:MAG: phage holin family protein [Lachnospiraceae bacterium]|nr:phage holin family protein [Lachnospiraceae bacterium]
MELKEKANILLGVDRVTNSINATYGMLAAVFAAIFGEQWYLFVGFFLLNIADYMTGYIKAKFYTKKESSRVGAIGIAKKVAYWTVIAVAFFISLVFEKMGNKIGINLSFVVMLGYFVIAAYIVNEIRSILENMVVMNVKIPAFLIKGLEIVEQKITEATEFEEHEEQEGKQDENSSEGIRSN